jgi:transposase-like protein
LCNRIRSESEKVQKMTMILQTINIEAAARCACIPPSTVRYDLDKIIDALPITLANKQRGPARKSEPSASAPTNPQNDRPICPTCGQSAVKNGGYWVINWIALLLTSWLGLKRIRMQRWRCTECNVEIASPHRIALAKSARAWWQKAMCIVVEGRFRNNLSSRQTRALIMNVLGRPVSLGYISACCQRSGTRAQSWLKRLVDLPQNAARVLLFDETFPRLKKWTHSLGVVMCENGLIRSVRVIRHKARDITAQLRQVTGHAYQPQCFLTDLEKHYRRYAKLAGLSLVHYRDKVHVLRHLARLLHDTVRQVSLQSRIAGLSATQRTAQRALKQHLVAKRLVYYLNQIRAAFDPLAPTRGVDAMFGIVTQLEQDAYIGGIAAVQELVRKLRRFFTTHRQAITFLIEFAHSLGLPETTNSLESKNSLFKMFSHTAKYFGNPRRTEQLFSAVAVFENFDCKTRGPNAGSSAISRAGVVCPEENAFDVLGVEIPQITLEEITSW